MRFVRNGFVTAIAVTVLDLSLASHCGPLLWQVFGAFPWTRVAILFMAGAGSFTLMDIWARAVVLLPIAIPLKGPEQIDAPPVVTATNLMEGADV